MPDLVENDSKDCPFCAERIKVNAIVCRHCGRDIVPAATGANLAKPLEFAKDEPGMSSPKFAAIVFWKHVRRRTAVLHDR
jgi:hypothetical protein